jgi:hypothetical protein
MEVGQGPNWSCSAKEKKKTIAQRLIREGFEKEMIVANLKLLSFYFD